MTTKVVNIRAVGVRDALKAGDPQYVYCGRAMPRQGLKGSKWGNPFKIGIDGDRWEVIAKHRAWIRTQPKLMAALPELRGKTLVCWCKPDACHCDVLAELADADATPNDPEQCAGRPTHEWYYSQGEMCCRQCVKRQPFVTRSMQP